MNHEGLSLMALDEWLTSNGALPSIPKIIVLLLNELSRQEPDVRKNLASAAAVAGAFRMVGGVDMHQFWRYSLNVAKLSRTLAGRVRQNLPAAFTAGLIHAIGELVLHTRRPQEMAVLDQKTNLFSLKRTAAERSLLGFNYADVGAGFGH